MGLLSLSKTWLRGLTEPQAVADVPQTPEPLATRAEAKAEVRQEVLNEVGGELVRAMNSGYASSDPKDRLDPMMGAQLTQAKNGETAYAMNTPWPFVTPQPPYRHPGSLVSVDTLRRFSQNYDILRACIMHIQQEIATTIPTVAAIDGNDKSPETAAEIKAAQKLFTRKGVLGGPGKTVMAFETAWVEDLCVVGAAAFHFQPNRGGGLFAVRHVDAVTIRPVLDVYGWPPMTEDEIAYEQWVMGLRVQQFSRRELLYEGIYARTNNPYFWSPVEFLILVVQAALSADQWNRNWLTDGNIPDTLISVPETWTPDQIIKYSQYFDALLAGNIEQRVRGKFVPGGMKVLDPKSRKDQDFQAFEMWLLRRCCAIMGVNPASIGFSEGLYKQGHEASLEQTSAFGISTIMQYRRNTYNDVLERAGFTRVEVKQITERYESPLDRATRHQIEIMVGETTPNEARKESGKPPLPDGDTLLVQSAMVPLSAAIKTPNIPAAQAGAQAKGQDKKTSNRGFVLRQWKTKAENSVKRGKSAAVPFLTDALTSLERAWIEQGLAQCTTEAEVRAFFEDVSQELSDVADS